MFDEVGPRYVGTDTAALAWCLGPPGSPVARGMDVCPRRPKLTRRVQPVNATGSASARRAGTAGSVKQPSGRSVPRVERRRIVWPGGRLRRSRIVRGGRWIAVERGGLCDEAPFHAFPHGAAKGLV